MLARQWRVAVVVAVAFVAAVWVARLGPPPDDAFITYQYAKRLAAGEGFTFSPGASPTYGATSPLWTLLLAAVARVGWAPHLSAPWLIAFCHAGAAGLLASVAGGWAGLAWAMALVPLTQTGGMETGLLIALMLLALVLVWRDASPLLLGSVAGLLLWTRPEAALFVLALAAAAAMGPRWRGRRGALVILVAGALYLPWALYARHVFGDLVPLGARGKWAMGWFYPKLTLTRVVARWFPAISACWLSWPALCSPRSGPGWPAGRIAGGFPSWPGPSSMVRRSGRPRRRTSTGTRSRPHGSA